MLPSATVQPDALPARPVPPAGPTVGPYDARQQYLAGNANQQLAKERAAADMLRGAAPMQASAVDQVQALGHTFGQLVASDASPLERALAAGNLALAALPMGAPERLGGEAVPEMLAVEHYSPHAIEDVVSPFAGKVGPVRGAERARQAQFPELYSPRSHFQVAGTQVEPGFEHLPVYHGQIPASQVYDLSSDPLGLHAQAERLAAQNGTFGPAVTSIWENLIRNSGYSAIRQGNVVASFAPVAVERGPHVGARIFSRLAAGEGFTLNPREGMAPFTGSGYLVADPALTETNVRSAADVKAFLARPEVKRALEHENAYVGGWQNEINVSHVVPRRETALDLGLRRNQAAVGQIRNGEYVGDVPVQRSTPMQDVIAEEQFQGTAPAEPTPPQPTPGTPALTNSPIVLPAQRERLIADRIMQALASDRQDLLATQQARRTAAEVYRHIPVEPLAAGALAGVTKRGWYANSARALVDIFGPDAPRFASLLAALSPQSTVEENLKSALEIWNFWREMPATLQRDPETLAQAFAVATGHVKEMEGRIGNAVRALTADDPVATVLSGPKVDAFRRNLLGDVQHATLDTWMAKGANIPQTAFGGRAPTKDQIAGGRPADVSVAPPGYLAYEARLAETADQLSKMTGRRWTVPEVQETVWSWLKSLEEGTSVAATPDFASLMGREPYAGLLRQGGLPEPLVRPMKKTPIVEPDQGALNRLGENLRRYNRGDFLRLNERGVVGIPEAIGTGLPVEMPDHPQFENAVRNTPGAKITPQGLELDLQRFQNPNQAGEPSARRGVFYLPQGAAQARWFKSVHPTPGKWYGGPQEITGRTLFRRPLFVQGAAGGGLTQAGLNRLLGKVEARQLESDITQFLPYSGRVTPEHVQWFLEQHGGNPAAAHEIATHQQLGNRLAFALKENILAERGRQAGYDGIIGYNAAWGNAPKIREVFDLREGNYPVPGERSQPTMRVGGQSDLFNTQGRGALPMLALTGGAAGAALTAALRVRRRPRKETASPGRE